MGLVDDMRAFMRESNRCPFVQEISIRTNETSLYHGTHDVFVLLHESSVTEALQASSPWASEIEAGQAARGLDGGRGMGSSPKRRPNLL